MKNYTVSAQMSGSVWNEKRVKSNDSKNSVHVKKRVIKTKRACNKNKFDKKSGSLDDWQKHFFK